LASSRDLSRLQSEKDALEETGVALAQQLESVKGLLRGSQTAEEKLRLDLEATTRSLEERSAQSSEGSEALQALESSLAESRKREDVLREENEALRVQLRALQEGAEEAAAASLRQAGRGSRSSNVENLSPQQGAPAQMPPALPSTEPAAPGPNMPLSSSYLINRIQMLQARLDKGIVE
jgi:chromosome segregation ATPase